MRNPQGYATIVGADRSVVTFDKFRCEEIRSGTMEVDTFTCIHCNGVRHVKPMSNMDEFGSMCRNCMKMVCPVCANGPCVPFLKKIEQMEQKDYIRRQYDLVL